MNLILQIFKRLFKIFSKNSKNENKKSTFSFRIGPPNDPIPEDYLEDIKDYFEGIGVVKRACYCLYETDSFSYLVLLDLEINNNHTISEAINIIASNAYVSVKTPYKGRWPILFGPWGSIDISVVLAQNPNLQFYNRDKKNLRIVK